MVHKKGRERNYQISNPPPQRKLYLVGLVALAAIIIGLAWADQMTVSTYYPAPYGVYNEMRVMKSLGVGTTDPTAELEVVGLIKLGSYDNSVGSSNPPPTPASENEGALYYDTATKTVYYSNGSEWLPMGAGEALFGEWQNTDVGQEGGSGANLAIDVVYQAKTDGLVVAYTPNSGTALGYTDSDRTKVAGRNSYVVRQAASLEGSGNDSITMPVKKGHYWQVYGNPTIFWIPIEK